MQVPNATAIELLSKHGGELVVDEIVSEYIGAVFELWNLDGNDVQELIESIEPILLGAGLSSDSFQQYLDALDQAYQIRSRKPGTQNRSDSMPSQVVPLETPVQMNLSPITAQMVDAPKQVRLDWLSNRRVMATQVDRSKLEKAESKLRAKAAERKDRKLVNSTTDPDAEAYTNRHEKRMDPREIVDIMLAENEQRYFERDIHIDSFDIAIAGRRILTGAKLLLAHGRRYGLIGRNGIGKSTLLRHIADRELSLPQHLSILHVEQEVVGDDTTALKAVLSADFRREALLFEEARLNALLSDQESSSPTTVEEIKEATDRLQAIYQKLEELDSDTAESRAAEIMSGLGFATTDQARKTKEFSGGWRMRLALAQALFCEPDILLLDEPTNMLDFPAVVWLEEYLCKWEGTILVVSHDRYFLDSVATDIIHMHDEVLDPYRGNYNQFLVTRAERLKNQQREYEAQVLYRQHLQAFIDRWRYNANRAPQAQSRLKILEKLPELRPVIIEGPIVFRFPLVESLSPPIIMADEASFGYTKDAVLLEKITINIQLDSRIAIVGPNGAGKTTLLKLLVGELEPQSGKVFIHGRLRVAYFNQHHIDQLDLNLTPLQHLISRYPGKTEEEYRQQLGAFGLSGPLALQQIKTLSGGQKSRVAFASMCLVHPHLMILDEPTNHLDMDSIDALIRALKEYQGGVVVVSHDKKFIDSLCGQILVCREKGLERFEGTIHEYAKLLIPSIGSHK